jgi:hypothetical protein
MAPKLQQNYLRSAEFLMDDVVWGAQGAAQKQANHAWVRYIKAKDAAFSRVASRTSRDMAGNWEHVADPAKIASRVRDIGRAEGKLADDQFREFVSASRGLSDAIGEGYELGADKVAALGRLRTAADRVDGTLGKADKTVRLVNQLDELDKMSRSTGLNVPLLGGLAGGPVGAAAGAVWSAVSNPSALIRTMGAVEAMRRNVNTKLDGGIKAFFERHSTPRLPSPRGIVAGAKKTGKVAKAATVPASLALFSRDGERPRAAYKRRVSEIIEMAAGKGEAARAKAQAALGDSLSAQAPKLAGIFTTRATTGAMFLASKIPAGIIEPNRLQPSLHEPAVSDSEIAQFARYWTAVANPLSVLDDLRRGTLTHEQVEALRSVYPEMYGTIRERVMAQIAEQRALLPLQAVIQLDLLLDLKGAGEPLLDPAFMIRYTEYVQQAAQASAQSQGASPRGRPITGLADKYASRLQSVQSTAEAVRS